MYRFSAVPVTSAKEVMLSLLFVCLSDICVQNNSKSSAQILITFLNIIGIELGMCRHIAENCGTCGHGAYCTNNLLHHFVKLKEN